ncbi:hypothetical protein AB6A23_23340 [Paenibacillus tarimensis]
MIKKIAASGLILILVLLFSAYHFEYISDINYERIETESFSSAAGSRTGESDTEFLSDEYFAKLDEVFEQVKIKHDKWFIRDSPIKAAAEAVIHQMMDDLEKNPDALTNHRNFNRFFETFDRNIKKLDSITERMHFFRNTLNSYSNAPSKLDDMIDLAARGKWKLFSAKFHRYNYKDINGALNVKFISADGRFEAVYNTGTGKIVDDPANMGTYNYALGSINPLNYMHSKFDKNPWKKWGNIKGFTYKDIISLESEHGSAEANNNYKEVERRIQQRKNESGFEAVVRQGG